jgi:hypothetical protein
VRNFTRAQPKTTTATDPSVDAMDVAVTGFVAATTPTASTDATAKAKAKTKVKMKKELTATNERCLGGREAGAADDNGHPGSGPGSH